jgi:hypothetical protein
MSTRTRILNRFDPGQGEAAPSAPLLLDLTLWHKWHAARGTLPPGFGPTGSAASLIDAHRALGAAIWAPFKPWRTEHVGIDVTTAETADRREIAYRVGGRTLLAVWTRGPDGDWWQTEYPVRTVEDLALAVDIAAARRYVLDPAGLDEWRAAVGEDGVVALDLPMQPYSDLLHVFVGWGEGLLLMQGAGKAHVAAIVAVLERKLAALAAEIAALPGDLLLAADNLDGQYVSPRGFKEYMASSYAATAGIARAAGKPLVVHVGGPAKRLAPLLQQAGVDGIEGIAGPPQSDATLAEARESAGPDLTLWGGVSQDMLIAEHDAAAFEAAARAALEQTRGESRMILGVADRVPPDAGVARLRRLVEMVG